MIRIFVVLALLFPSIVFADCTSCHAGKIEVNEKVIEEAMTYLYVKEASNNNDHEMIDLWLKRCSLGKGYPYCQAFVANMYENVFGYYFEKNSPFPMYAGVARFAQFCVNRPLTFKVISTKKMAWGVDKPEPGDVVSWKHGSSKFTGFNYRGHAGLVISVNDDKTVNTIEANTKSGPGGDQSGTVKGDLRYGMEGVYLRTRSISLDSNFPIMYFIRLQKREFDYEPTE